MKKLSLSLLFLCGLAIAQIPADVKQEIDQRVQHQINPSIVVGVYQQGESQFYIQGLQNQALKTRASEHSIYEIGSISKTFTALLLAKKVQANEITLDDAIQDKWPKPFRLVDSEQQAITFKQLATHTSGLPRLPSNLSVFSQNPYADYDRTKLMTGVNNSQPSQAGATYVYSNFGVGLLGETLAVMANRPYHDLLKSEIFEPLNLKQTYGQLAGVPVEQLAQGYMGDQPVPAWQFKALAGAGAIRSSVQDLLAFGVAHLIHPQGNMKDAMALTTSTHYQQNQLKVGLGWHINGNGIIWHNGATAGFNSIIMIDPIQQKVVAGITNHNNSIEDIVIHIMDPSQPLKSHDFPVPISTAELMQFTGQFKQVNKEQKASIQLINNQLFLIAIKQPKYAMTYIGDDSFKLNLAKVKLTFNRDDQGQINSLDLDGWGKPQKYKKVSQ